MPKKKNHITYPAPGQVEADKKEMVKASNKILSDTYKGKLRKGDFDRNHRCPICDDMLDFGPCRCKTKNTFEKFAAYQSKVKGEGK